MASSSSQASAKPEFGGCGGEASEAAAVMVGTLPKGSDELAMCRGIKKAKKDRGCTAKERISKMVPCTAGKRSSIYRGVTRHRWTGRYEAHLWDKSTWNQNQNKKGKQVYLGAYDDEEAAARAYDLAALKYWGPGTLINFPVTDYTRDLEEMQNVSREDYLASLRRKSSGFSRGISKYRPLSSRWDPQFAHVPGSDYFSRMSYGTGDDATAENNYPGGFCIERKIDLTGYIKWWGTNKQRQVDSHIKSEETKLCSSENFGGEKAMEWSNQITEPYEMPRLGMPQAAREHKVSTVSAMSILARSAAFKSLQEKGLRKKEADVNDENENKNIINKADHGKAVEKSTYDTGSERHGAGVGSSGGLPIQRSVYPLSPLLSAPLLTNYNAIDSMTDPVLWTSLISVLPAGSSRAAEVPKNESSSSYTLFQQED